MQMDGSRLPKRATSGRLAGGVITDWGSRRKNAAGKRVLTGSSSYSNSPAIEEPHPPKM